MLDWLELPGNRKDKAPDAGGLREEVRRLRPAEELMLSGERLYDDGEFDLAAREFGRARRHDPALFPAWAEEVDSQLRAGNVPQADATATEAIGTYGQVPLFYAAKAIVLAHQGYIEAAYQHSDISVKHQDSSIFTWLSRGEVVLSAATPGTLRSAEACFDNACQRDPTHWRAKFRAGLICIQWGYIERALERLSQAVEINSGNPFLWKLMADCHRQLGHAPAARECYEFALVRRPAYAPALAALRSMTPWGRFRAQVAKWLTRKSP
jgi:tetratricopeptide (TPR) repeat protein